MAGPAPRVPNLTTAMYIFDNVWTVARVEAYVTAYQPGGISLPILRRALGHGHVNPGRYARVLSNLAAVLFVLGHTKTVTEVLLELFLLINPLHLTLDQVGLIAFAERLIGAPDFCKKVKR